MSFLKFLFFTFSIISISMCNAQNLEDHIWKNRLVIILVNDESNQVLENQILELEKSNDGLLDRRIIVYQALPEKYREGLFGTNQWNASDQIYKKLNQRDLAFEILLIGLDGGIKLRKNELLKCEELFGLIDVMPMRRAKIEE